MFLISYDYNMTKTFQNDYEIVVAHYSENLDWLKPYADHAIIYHKGKEDKPRFDCKKRIKLDNIWREWHTYLYHILNNYDNLPNYTFFFQWGIEDHRQSWDVYKNIEKYFIETRKYGFSCASLLYLIRKNPQIRHWWKWLKMLEDWTMLKAKFSFSEFYNKLFWENQKLITPFFYAANFWVSKKLIQSRGKWFWENAMTLMPEHPNPEEWHYFERLWFRIFNKKWGFAFRYIFKFIKTLFVAWFYKLFKK